ncbi:conjugative transposon membrane protein [Enterococcus sp. DIV2379]
MALFLCKKNGCDNLKKIRSYTSIWSVEKVLYAINDLQLPFPITFTQMTWFVVSLLMVILFGNIPPLSFIDGALLKYVGLPAALTWVMSQKTFDGKKPYGFLKSILSYWLRPKVTCAGKTVKLQNQKLNEAITIVRSELYYGISN